MDYYDWYLQQVVTESEMDAAFAAVLNSFRRLRAESGLGQGAVADALKYGGILRGLSVTKVTTGSYANKAIAITPGVAVDDSNLTGNTEAGGRLVPLKDTAYVALTNQGDTTTDTPGTSSAPVVGNGSAITVAAGQSRVVSVYIVPDIKQSDTRTDGGGATVQFKNALSYHFHIKSSGEYPVPPSGAITPPSLESGKILLCDIILDENEEILVVSGTDCIINTTQDADDVGYGPNDTAALEGRRSDLLAFDSGKSSPRATDLICWKDWGVDNDTWQNLRAGNPRQALYDLLKALQSQATAPSLDGTAHVGSAARSVTAATAPYTAAGAQSLSAGSLHKQIQALLDLLDHHVARGGGSIVKPVASKHGLQINAETLSNDYALLQLQAAIDGTGRQIANFGAFAGLIPILPPGLYDDFNYAGNASNIWTPSANDCPWNLAVSGAGSSNLYTSTVEEGGVIILQADPPASGSTIITLSSNESGVAQVKAGVSPFGIAYIVFKIASITDAFLTFSINSVGGNSYAQVQSTPATGDLQLTARDSVPNPPTSGVSVGTIAAGTWHTLALATDATNRAKASLDNGAWVSSGTTTGTFDTDLWYVSISLTNTNTAATKTLDVDKIIFVKGGLPTHLQLT